MPSSTTLTFRNQTTGSINDLLQDENLQCVQSQNLLTYLVGALVNYKEEGVDLSPSILFCESVDRVFEAIPGVVRYQIGEASLSPEAGPQILKDCAPLAGRHWLVFIERKNPDQMAYGVFSYPVLPTALPLNEAITISESGFTVLIRTISPNTVEIVGARGSRLVVVFSTIREHTGPATDPVGGFVASCCRDIAETPSTEGFTRYFTQLVERALTTSHGTMLVCTDKIAELLAAPQFRDARAVEPSLDLVDAFAEYQRSPSAEAIVRLQSYEELLIGLFRSDGIVVFSTSGAVLAYRLFFRLPEEVPSSGTTIVGGTRRRAFEGLKALGHKLIKGIPTGIGM
jgi:hypothetical protein